MNEVEEYISKGYWGNQVLGDVFDHTVRDYPDRIALAQGERRISYREFGRTVDRLSLKLLEMEVGKGDFVVILLPNCLEYAFFHYAVAKIGAVGVPMVHTQKVNEIRYVVNLFEARTLVVSLGLTKYDFPQMADGIRGEFPFLKNVVVVGDPPSYPDMIPFQSLVSGPVIDEEDRKILRRSRPRGTDMVRVILSAGTTGPPKAAVRTHNDTVASLRWDGVFHDWGENLLLFFPFGHTTGYFMGLDLQVYMGRRITLTSGKFENEDVFRLIETEEITSVWMPTPLLFNVAQAIGEDPQLAYKYNLSSLKKFVFGGAQAAPDLIRTLREATGRPVLQTWGMAEGAVTSSLITDPPDVQAFTIGKIQCPDAKVKVIDEDGMEVPVGCPGELIYKGPFLFSGYYKDPELTKKSIDEDGFFHSGDQVVLDPSGNIKIVGRLKDIVRRGGEPISPAEIEDLIQGHEKVSEVAVVGMPDKRMVEKLCAYIVPKANSAITFDEIIGFLKGKNIATYKLPERIEFIDQLPRGEQKGNVLKKQLKEDITNKLRAEGKI